MAQRQFKIQLPDTLLRAFAWPEGEVPARIREILVMDALRQDRLSEAEAAQLLGLGRGRLLDLMGRVRVPAVRLTAKELKREVAGLHS